MTTLLERVGKVAELAAARSGEKKALEAQLQELNAAYEKVDGRIHLLKDTAALLQKVSDRIQEVGIGSVEAFVTEGIRRVFDDTYRFRIKFDYKYSRYEARFLVSHTRRGREIENEVRLGHGHGLVEVAGLLLQVAVLVSKTEALQVLFLDDPVGHLPERQVREVGAILQEIGEELRIVYTTTNQTLAKCADRVHFIEWLDDGTAGIKEG